MDMRMTEILDEAESADQAQRQPQHHRSIDCITQILEEVVYNPGLTFAALARTLGAPKSSVYGFMRGLLATGWLYEQEHRLFIGPAMHGLTLASGQVRAGLISHDRLAAFHHETGLAVFLGVGAGDHLIYIAEAGGDAITDIEARRNIRRTLLATATGKALLAARPRDELQAFLRQQSRKDASLVQQFVSEYDEIKRTGVATNIRLSGTRIAIATVIPGTEGKGMAAVALVGAAPNLEPRLDAMKALLLARVKSWAQDPDAPREAI